MTTSNPLLMARTSAMPVVMAVREWTGREVRLLRQARRMSIRDFAAHLGVSPRMVSKWEAAADRIRPRPVNQDALDTSLAHADQTAQQRFVLLAGTTHPSSTETDNAPNPTT